MWGAEESVSGGKGLGTDTESDRGRARVGRGVMDRVRYVARRLALANGHSARVTV